MTTIEFTATKEFIEAFKLAASVAPKTGPKDILKHVKVTVTNEDVVVEATNLQTYFRRTVSVPTSTPESMSGMIHRDAVKALKPGVRVTITDRNYTIGSATLLSEDPLGFPSWPTLVAISSANVTQTYWHALKSCMEFADKKSYRQALTGICHRGTELIATDGLCLLTADAQTTFPHEFVLPAAAVPSLAKAFRGSTSATVITDLNYVRYADKHTTVVVRLNNSVYPTVAKLFEGDFQPQFIIHDTHPWLEILENIQTMLAISDRRECLLRLQYNGKQVNLHTCILGSTFDTSIDVEGVSQHEWHYTVDPAHLRKALTHLPAPVTVLAAKTTDPICLESTGRKALVAPRIPR